jgi:hypothetical protein
MEGGLEERLNHTINWYDPPKDLAIGNFLKNHEHKEIIKACMIKLFGSKTFAGVKIPDDSWVAVGKSIKGLTESINTLYGSSLNKQNIIREKHSSGTSNRPGDLFVMQDNGPIDVVSNPTFIITPGSILDPAGKTKDGAKYITDGDSSILETKYTSPMGFSSCITGDISITKYQGNYIITMPTSLNLINGGTIRGVFNTDTFKPVDKANESIYFQGNNIKNGLISEAAKEKSEKNSQEIMAHILMKELGDTLQVAWVKKLYELSLGQLNASLDPPPAAADLFTEPITQRNSVIITSDAIVQYRAIVNNIAVIFTEKSKTTYICPASGASKAIMDKAFISTMIKDLHTHNMSILRTFDAVIANGIEVASEGGAFSWLGNSWRKEEVILYAIEILKQIRKVLISFINDTHATLSLLNDVETAKKIVEGSLFICPFVKKTDGFKIIKTIIYLLPNNKIRFTANAFLPSKIYNANNIIDSDAPPKKFSGGGEYIQEGGIFNIHHVAVVYAAAMGGGGGGAGAGAAPSQPAQLLELYGNLNKNIKYYDSGNPEQDLIDLRGFIKRPDPPFDPNTINFMSDVERVNITQDIKAESLTNGLLYCLIKEYHPEIFTYARFMSISLETPGPYDEILSNEAFLSHFNEEDAYMWDPNRLNYFHDNDVSPLSVGQKGALLQPSIRAIRLARKFITLFPAFNSKELASFINLAYRHYPILNRKEEDEKIKNQELFTHEGGGEEDTMAADIAIDLYEPYYSLLLRSSYSNVDINLMIRERLEFILPFDPSIPEEFKDDSVYKHSRKKVFNLLVGELESLPLVAKFLPEAMKAVHKFYSRHDISRIHSMSIPDLIMSIYRNKYTTNPMFKAPKEISVYSGGRFSKLRITRKTRRSNPRNRSTRIKKSKVKKTKLTL